MNKYNCVPIVLHLKKSKKIWSVLVNLGSYNKISQTHKHQKFIPHSFGDWKSENRMLVCSGEGCFQVLDVLLYERI